LKKARFSQSWDFFPDRNCGAPLRTAKARQQEAEKVHPDVLALVAAHLGSASFAG
jgi:hypothetical protein